MSLPNITVKIGEESVTLSLPIGGFEKIAKVNPYPEELWNAFRIRQYSVEEVRAVIEAGLHWGGSGLEADDVIDGVGLRTAAKWSEQLLEAAIRPDDDDTKKKDQENPDAPSS